MEGPNEELFGWTVGASGLIRERHRRQSSRVIEGRTCDRIEKRIKTIMSPYEDNGVIDNLVVASRQEARTVQVPFPARGDGNCKRSVLDESPQHGLLFGVQNLG